MHFTTQHRFPAAPARVAALMVDPEFEGAVQLPDLSPPYVIEHDTDGNEHVLKLRYDYVGQLEFALCRAQLIEAVADLNTDMIETTTAARRGRGRIPHLDQK